jgi:hypothetical protein
MLSGRKSTARGQKPLYLQDQIITGVVNSVGSVGVIVIDQAVGRQH